MGTEHNVHNMYSVCIFITYRCLYIHTGISVPPVFRDSAIVEIYANSTDPCIFPHKCIIVSLLQIFHKNDKNNWV